jgi:hypothetical protein
LAVKERDIERTDRADLSSFGRQPSLRDGLEGRFIFAKDRAMSVRPSAYRTGSCRGVALEGELALKGQSLIPCSASLFRAFLVPRRAGWINYKFEFGMPIRFNLATPA